MSSKDEVFEYLIDQLRQRVSKFDVVAEIHKMSIDRTITGRSGYSDKENAIIDAYIGRDSDSERIIHNLKQHLARKDDEIHVLKARLCRAKDKVKELRGTIEHMNLDFDRVTSCHVQEDANTLSDKLEHSDGWIEWRGVGDPPVPNNTKVEVELRFGKIMSNHPSAFRWEQLGAMDDIIKYRVIK